MKSLAVSDRGVSTPPVAGLAGAGILYFLPAGNDDFAPAEQAGVDGEGTGAEDEDGNQDRSREEKRHAGNKQGVCGRRKEGKGASDAGQGHNHTDDRCK